MAPDPSTDEKVDLLMRQASQDHENPALDSLARDPLRPFNIRHLSDRGFGRPRLFRILLSNACVFSCSYCPMRSERDLPRHALSPEKLAEVFLEAHRRGWAQGLFVTSGIPKNSVWAMDRLIALVELLRFKHRFAGYIHAKAVAGCRLDQVDRLVLLVDRMSYNLESACEATLKNAAPEKSVSDGLAVLERARSLAGNSPFRRVTGDPRPPGRALGAGATTQFVVGLGDETDRELLEKSRELQRKKTIHHTHFAAFRPIVDTPMAERPETPALREHRLYQAEFLLRVYPFEPSELVFDDGGNLPLQHDPKMAWALWHEDRFPVELATASRDELLRVPGLGPRSVERLLIVRRSAASFTARDLTRAGAVASRAAGFLSFRGRRLSAFRFQPALFPPTAASERVSHYTFSPGTFR
jgi:predicted DNA-binding helix-hairpin-helix protein